MQNNLHDILMQYHKYQGTCDSHVDYWWPCLWCMTQRRRPWPPHIRLSVLMVLSDDGEMTLSVLPSSADPPADVTQPGISPHRDKSVSLPRWKYFISSQLQGINRSRGKINKNLARGCSGIKYGAEYHIFCYSNISIFKYSFHFRTFAFALHLQCNTPSL